MKFGERNRGPISGLSERARQILSRQKQSPCQLVQRGSGSPVRSLVVTGFPAGFPEGTQSERASYRIAGAVLARILLNGIGTDEAVRQPPKEISERIAPNRSDRVTPLHKQNQLKDHLQNSRIPVLLWAWNSAASDRGSYVTIIEVNRLRASARVAELADAPDLGSGGETHGGSSPPFRTMKSNPF